MVAGLAVAGAVATAHGELLVLAVVPLVLLALTPRSVAPATVDVTVALSPSAASRATRSGSS